MRLLSLSKGRYHDRGCTGRREGVQSLRHVSGIWSKRIAHRAIGAALCFLVLGLAPFASPVAVADDFVLGREAYLQGNFAEALRLWAPLADENDPRAQFSIGSLYFEGRGVTKDLSAAARWFRRAAEQGYAAAQFNLGNSYKHGQGVPQDDLEAVKWWTLAAEQEFAPAQFNLGTQYYFGRGVPKDQQKGLRWYKRAADNGHPRARELFAIAPEETEAQPPASTAVSSREAPPPEIATGGMRDEAWILAQDPSRFTVQLATIKTRASIPEFADRHGIADRVAYYRFERSNASWFAVIYGVFERYRDAEQAIEDLPEALKRASPLVRPMAVVQRAVRAQQGTALAASREAEARAELPQSGAPSTPLAAAGVTAPGEAKDTPVPSGTIKREAWILAQDPSAFTVQLAALNEEGSIPSFGKRHGLTEDIAYYRFERDGRPWFAVIYGIFARRSEAEQAIGRLSPQLRKASPWIRPLRVVQTIIHDSGS